MDYKCCYLCHEKRNLKNSRCCKPVRQHRFHGIYHRTVDLSAKASAQNNGRNTIMVFTIHGISGLITYWRWKYRWILSFSTLVSAVFCIINILKPEIHDQSLMPALQSAWFIPHVTVYMFSYSVLGCAFIIGCIGMKKHKEIYTLRKHGQP